MAEKIKVVFFDDTDFNLNTSTVDSVNGGSMLDNGLYFSPSDSPQHHIAHFGHIYTLGSSVTEKSGNTMPIATIDTNTGKVNASNVNVVSGMTSNVFNKNIEFTKSNIDLGAFVTAINLLVDKCNSLQNQIDNINSEQTIVTSFFVNNTRTGTTNTPSYYIVGDKLTVQLDKSSIQPSNAIYSGFGITDNGCLSNKTESSYSIDAIITNSGTITPFLYSPNTNNTVNGDSIHIIAKDPQIKYSGKYNGTVLASGTYNYIGGSLQDSFSIIDNAIKTKISDTLLSTYVTNGTNEKKTIGYYYNIESTSTTTGNSSGTLFSNAIRVNTTPTYVSTSNILTVSKYIVRVSRSNYNDTTSYIFAGTASSPNTISQIITAFDSNGLAKDGYTYTIYSDSVEITNLSTSITSLTTYNLGHCKQLEIIYNKEDKKPNIYCKVITPEEQQVVLDENGTLEDLLRRYLTLTENNVRYTYDEVNNIDISGKSITDKSIKQIRLDDVYPYDAKDFCFLYSDNPFNLYVMSLDDTWEPMEVYYYSPLNIYLKPVGPVTFPDWLNIQVYKDAAISIVLQ